MAQQIIITGNSASDGNGEPLRTAFTKINENFTELYSGNVQVTAANILVYSVAGRTGNITLSTSDVAGAASVGYVNNAIAANIANYTGSIISGINANITAANTAIGENSSRIATLEANVNTNTSEIAVLFNDKANISFVNSSIENAISTSIVALTTEQINANVTAANLKIDSLSANAAVQAIVLDSLQANAATQSIDIANLLANSASQAISLNQLTANSAFQETEIFALQVNTGVLAGRIDNLENFTPTQSSKINQIDANVAAANIQINNLWSNATTQAQYISSLFSNVGAIINSTNANAATQSDLITYILANIGGIINSTNANASTQALAISSVNANVTSLTNSTTANAAAQGSLINQLFANAASQATSLSTLTANAATQGSQIDTLNSAVYASNLQITAIQSNISTSIFGLFDKGNAALADIQNHLSVVDTSLASKADIYGQIFNGNVQAPYFLSNVNVKTQGYYEAGPPNPKNYPNLIGIITNDLNDYSQFIVQNLNSGDSAQSLIAFTADVGDNHNNFLQMGINSSTFYDHYLDTGIRINELEGFVDSRGGNLILRSDKNVTMMSYSSIVGLKPSGDFTLYNCNIAFRDGTVQSTAAQFDAGGLSFTMGTPGDWINPVYNIHDALNQLAARLKASGH